MAARETVPWVLPSWPWTLRVLAVAALFGAEILHLAVLPGAVADGWAAAAAVAVAAAVEGLVAVWLAVAPSRTGYAAAVVTGLPTLAVGLAAGAVGLPVGPFPWTAAALPPAEVVALCFAGLSVAAVLPLVENARARLRARRGSGTPGALVAAAVIVAALGVPVGSALGPLPAAPVVTDHAH